MEKITITEELDNKYIKAIQKGKITQLTPVKLKRMSSKVNLEKIISQEEKLRKITKKVIDSLEIENTLKNTVTELLNLFGLARCEMTLMHFDQDKYRGGEKHVLTERYSANTFSRGSIKKLIEQGPIKDSIDYILKYDLPLLCNDTMQDPYRHIAKKLDVGSFLNVPLTVGEKRVGYIHAAKKRKNGFSYETIKSLTDEAPIIAVAVRNSLLYKKQEKMAVTDGLTELNNHEEFKRRLIEATSGSRRYKTPLSMLMIDIDHFKKINDTYGHLAGDYVLRGISKIIKESQRESDIVARYGGEEIAIILPHIDEAGAYINAERLRKTIEEEKFTYEGKDINVTVSAGIAQYKRGEEDKTFVNRADKYMYCAKGDNYKIKGKLPRNKVMGEILEKKIRQMKDYDAALKQIIKRVR
jgi:diguanylate cyclase (GGDEF)-like protein